MQVLRHPHDVTAFIQSQPTSEISTLIQQRLTELLDDYTAMEELVFIMILESSDTVADLEAHLGRPVCTTDGYPLWEVIEPHLTCFEMVFVLASSGYGALVLVPYLDANTEPRSVCCWTMVPDQPPQQWCRRLRSGAFAGRPGPWVAVLVEA